MSHTLPDLKYKMSILLEEPILCSSWLDSFSLSNGVD